MPFMKADKHPRWNGGRKIHSDGYVQIYCPDHPNKDIRNYVLEHRLVMERYLGRYLTEDEIVHHINENKQDNRIENLKIMSLNEHMRMHQTKDMTKRTCYYCKGNKTYSDYRGFYMWYKHKELNNEWICNRCYSKFYK